MLLHTESSSSSYILPSPSLYLICPICTKCFPQITSIRIKEDKLQITLICDVQNKSNDYFFSDLLELLTIPPPSKGECCLSSLHLSKQPSSNTKYCIICDKWFCDNCKQYHDDLVFPERSEHSEKPNHNGINHLFLDREIYFNLKSKSKCNDRHSLTQRQYSTEVIQRQYCELVGNYYCENCKIDETCNKKCKHNWVDVDKEVNDLLPIHNEIELKLNETQFVNELYSFVDVYIKFNEKIISIENTTSVNNNVNNENDILKQIQIIKNAFLLNKTIHENYHHFYSIVNNNLRLMLYVNLYNRNIVQSLQKMNKFTKQHQQLLTNFSFNTINNNNNNNSSSSTIKNDNNKTESLCCNFYDLQRILRTEFYYNISELETMFYFSLKQHGVHSLTFYDSTLLSLGTNIKQSQYPYFSQTKVRIDNKTQINGLCVLRDKSIILYEEDKIIHFKPTKIKHQNPFEGWSIEKYDHKYHIWSIKEYTYESNGKIREPFLLLIDERNISVISTLKLKETSKPIYKRKHNFTCTYSGYNIKRNIKALLQLDNEHFAFGANQTINICALNEKDYYCCLECVNTTNESGKDKSNDGKDSLVSALIKINNADLYACCGYDKCVAVWNFFENEKKFYHVIGKHDKGVVDIISRKKNEVISLSSDGECHVRVVRVVGDNVQWKQIFTFRTKMQGGISLISMKEINNGSENNSNMKDTIIICAKDQIELWYANTGDDAYNKLYSDIEMVPYEKK